MAQVTKIFSGNILYDICPSGDAIFNNTSYDKANPDSYTSVEVLGDSETLTSIFQKISKMFANIRYLYTALSNKANKNGETFTGDITIGACTIHSDGRITVGDTTINVNGSITVGNTTISNVGAITTTQNIIVNNNGSFTIGACTIATDGSISIGGNLTIATDGSITIGTTTIGTDGSITAAGFTIQTDHASSVADKIVTLGSDGKYYYRTSTEILSDIGAGGTSSVDGTTVILP